MKPQTTTNVLWRIFVLVTAASCGSSKFESASQMLQSMHIDQSAFSKTPECQQIRVYTDVGMHFLDEGHAVAIVPSWVNETINNQAISDVAGCISQEGFYRLSMLAAQPNLKADVSLAITVLIYKAENTLSKMMQEQNCKLNCVINNL